MGGHKVRNRVIRFEVSTLTGGRWVIESLREDEAEAIQLARTMLASEKYEAVRVMRERTMLDGFSTTKPVYEERQGPRGKDRVKLSGQGEEGVWCETSEDFFGARSRRAIGNLLRSFLDQNGITVMELLHDYRWIKKFDAADGLKSAALHRIVRQRAEETGQSLGLCRKTLDDLIAQATTKARDLMASRALPRLLDQGLDGLEAACESVSPEPEVRLHLARFALCRALEPRQGLMDRLTFLIKLAEPATSPLAHGLFDAFAADCLASGPVLQDLLGRQPHLGQALIAIADLGEGKGPPAQAGAAPATGKLAALIAERPSAEIRAVLTDRLVRAISGEQRLSRGDAATEGALLQDLCGRLAGPDGDLKGGPSMVRALARRFAKLDLPGGLEDIRLAQGSATEQLEQLLVLERTAFSTLKKRAIATLALDLVRRVGAEDRAAMASLTKSCANSGFETSARQALAALLQS